MFDTKTTPSLKKKKVKGLHTPERKIRNIQLVQMSFCRKDKASHNNSLVVGGGEVWPHRLGEASL